MAFITREDEMFLLQLPVFGSYCKPLLYDALEAFLPRDAYA